MQAREKAGVPSIRLQTGALEGEICPVMAVNEGCGGAVTLRLAGTQELRGDHEGRRAWTLCTDIMNLGDGWSMGRHCDSVTASGALLLLQKKEKREDGGRGEEVN